jgi:hypothetical protein
MREFHGIVRHERLQGLVSNGSKVKEEGPSTLYRLRQLSPILSFLSMTSVATFMLPSRAAVLSPAWPSKDS